MVLDVSQKNVDDFMQWNRLLSRGAYCWNTANSFLELWLIIWTSLLIVAASRALAI